MYSDHLPIFLMKCKKEVINDVYLTKMVISKGIKEEFTRMCIDHVWEGTYQSRVQIQPF